MNREMELKDDGGSKKPQILDVDVPEMLKSEGLQVKEIVGPGKVVAIDSEGKEFDIDVPSMASDLLGDDALGSELKFKYNDKTKPVYISYEGQALDRAQLGVAPDEIKGNTKFLVEKYGKENVDFSEKDGFLINKDGIWTALDKNNAPVQLSLEEGGTWWNPADWKAKLTLGNTLEYAKDPWEITRDLADLSGMGPQAVATTIAGAKGGAAALAAAGPGLATLGPIAGPVAAAGIFAGGAALGAGATAAGTAAFRTLGGRALGTYDASPEDTVKDIALETFITMGGEVVAAGARPAISQIVKAAKNIRNSASKAVLSSVTGGMSQAGKAAMDTVIERPGDWARQTMNLVRKAPTQQAARESAERLALNATEELLELGESNLPKIYGQAMSEIKASPNVMKLNLNTDDALLEATKGLDEMGIGRVVPVLDATDDVIDPVMITTKRPGQTKVTGYTFQPYTETDIAGNPGRSLLDEKATVEIQKLVKELGSFRGQKLKGAPAVDFLVEMNKKINRLSTDAWKKGLSPESLRAYTQVQASLKNAVRDSFNKAGLGLEYKAMQDTYKRFADPVNMARKALNSKDPKAIGQVLDLITSESNRYSTTAGKQNIGEILALTGKQGQSLMDTISLNHSVARTMDWIRPGTLTTLGAVGASSLGGAPGVATFLAARSPRVMSGATVLATGVGRGTAAITDPLIEYSLKTLDTLKGLSPAAKRELDKNPQLLKSMFEETIGKIEEEKGMNEGMMQYIEESLK